MNINKTSSNAITIRSLKNSLASLLETLRVSLHSMSGYAKINVTEGSMYEEYRKNSIKNTKNTDNIPATKMNIERYECVIMSFFKKFFTTNKNTKM